MTERTIRYVRLDEVRPHPDNRRVHNLPLVIESIHRYGLVDCGVLDGRTEFLLGGHGRSEALTHLRAQGQEPPDGVRVDEVGEWWVPLQAGWESADDDEATAVRIILNRAADTAGWDTRGLVADLQHLASLESPFPVGYDDEADIAALLASIAVPVPVARSDPDAVPAVPAEPVSKPGDLWLLGPHRLLVGDATVRADYDRVLGGEHLAGAMVTDPPYGVAIGAKNRALDSIDRAGQVLTDLDGDQGIAEVEQLWKASFGVLHDVMPPGTPYYVFGPQGGDLGLLLLLLLLLRDSGLLPRHILIWAKNRPSFSIGRLDYDYQHEPIVYGWRPGGPHPWHAEGTRTSVLHFDRPQASPDHPTAKPVDLLAHLIENSTAVGETVLDPFAGSGSTLIAAARLGRRACLIEIDPHYCDVTCRRWEDYSGEAPVLEVTGEAHSFLAETDSGSKVPG